jgi:hypothetical protein
MLIMAPVIVIAAVVLMRVLARLIGVAGVVRMVRMVRIICMVRMICFGARFPAQLAIGSAMAMVVMSLMGVVGLAVGVLLGVLVILVGAVLIVMSFMVVVIEVALSSSARRRLRGVIVPVRALARFTRFPGVHGVHQPDGEQCRQPGFGSRGFRQVFVDASTPFHPILHAQSPPKAPVQGTGHGE